MKWFYFGLILLILSFWVEAIRPLAWAVLVVGGAYIIIKRRDRLFSKVRSRLLISFVFVGLVPMALFAVIVVAMAWFSTGAIGAAQVKKHLVRSQEQLDRLPGLLQQEVYRSIIQSDSVDHVGAVQRMLSTMPEATTPSILLYELDSLIFTSDAGLPATTVPSWYIGTQLTAITVNDSDLTIRTIADIDLGYGRMTMLASLPIDTAYQEMVWEETGAFVFGTTFIDRGSESDDEGRQVGQGFRVAPDIEMHPDTLHIALPQWLHDLRIVWLGAIAAMDWQTGQDDREMVLGFAVLIDPVYTLHTSTSQEYDQAGFFILVLGILAAILLVVELIAFLIGFIISRRITSAVHGLSEGTKALQQGNLDYRIETRRHDQLGEMGNSFNTMAQNIQDLLAKLQAHADELEVRVAERTSEIERSMAELKAAQSQMIQSEKMAALGKLVAGVVHEMNTPIGAINSATDTSNRCVTAIIDTLDTGDSIDEIKANPAMKRALQTLPDGNRVTVDASQRLSKIVSSLKSFTRLDEATVQEMDIHEGLDDTLTLMEHDLADRIQVVKIYGELPMVVCYPGEINQVFMHLISNASQAIASTGVVTIRTSATSSHVTIQIADTGRGIPEEQLANLFEPDFSHQGPRVKAGLGLFTTYNIIEKHDGRIAIESEVNRGTTVTVTLPVSVISRTLNQGSDDGNGTVSNRALES
jgi:signal transduction histidine kinase